MKENEQEYREGRNGGKLIAPPKGTWGNGTVKPGKRKVRSYLSTLDPSMRYSKDEIYTSFTQILTLDEESLQVLLKSNTPTVLEKVVASAILKGIKKGDLFSLETILSRVFGRPTQETKLVGDSESPLSIVFDLKPKDDIIDITDLNKDKD